MFTQWAGAIVDPLALLWLGLCGAAAWLGWKRRWRAAALIGSPAMLLFLFGSLPVPEALIAAREAPYAADLRPLTSDLRTLPADVVVMLGGILESSTNEFGWFSLGAGSQRLVTALELAQEGKAQALVLGGSGPLPDKPNEAVVSLLGDYIRQRKLCTVDVFHLGVCHNTHDEALRLNQLKTERGWNRITLVTSALHMKRAQATFQKLNGDVATVACDFRVYGVKREPWKAFPFPQSERLHLLQIYLHELVGYWVYRFRGWL